MVFTMLALVAGIGLIFSFTKKGEFDTQIKFSNGYVDYVNQTDLVYDQSRGDFNESAITAKNAGSIVICPGSGESCMVVVTHGMDNTTVYLGKKTVGGPDWAVYQ